MSIETAGAFTIGACLAFYILDRLYKRSMDARDRVIEEQREEIWRLSDALVDEGKRDKYRDIEREVEEMDDGWREEWGEQVWTPERRGR